MKHHAPPRGPRNQADEGPLFGPGAARHVELQGAVAAATIYSRAHDVFIFLYYLQMKKLELPVNANVVKGFASFLATREYSNRDARLSHIWSWLQASPTPQRLWHTVDRTEWSDHIVKDGSYRPEQVRANGAQKNLLRLEERRHKNRIFFSVQTLQG